MLIEDAPTKSFRNINITFHRWSRDISAPLKHESFPSLATRMTKQFGMRDARNVNEGKIFGRNSCA